MFNIQSPIIQLEECAAYETLWENEKANFKTLSKLFAAIPASRPSDFVNKQTLGPKIDRIKQIIGNNVLNCKIKILINGDPDYPKKLKDAKDPVEALYYAGSIELIHSKSVSVIGTRNPSPNGLRRTTKLVTDLVKNSFTIVSGLAAGIDTKAHETAITEKGSTIAVIGTPLDQFYPVENAALQKLIARNYLLLSQVPFIRYGKQSIAENRLFFPERNRTMSALTDATIIVEAGEASGTLIQARAALYQKRKLFILDSCFQNKALLWPERFLAQGAIRVKNIEDILIHFP